MKKEKCKNCEYEKNGYCEYFDDEIGVIVEECSAFKEKPPKKEINLNAK